MAQELIRFPRLIVDISDWGSLDKKQVVQLCIINKGKKSFVNVSIERSQFQDGKDNAYCIITNVSKDRDKAIEIPCRFDMDIADDEENAINSLGYGVSWKEW